MNGDKITVIFKRLKAIPIITETCHQHWGRNAMVLIANKQNKNHWYLCSKVMSRYLYKKVALYVWTSKSECYKVLFVAIEVSNQNWNSFFFLKKKMPKNYPDQNKV